jgi:hypothetical protein
MEVQQKSMDIIRRTSKTFEFFVIVEDIWNEFPSRFYKVTTMRSIVNCTFRRNV